MPLQAEAFLDRARGHCAEAERGGWGGEGGLPIGGGLLLLMGGWTAPGPYGGSVQSPCS